jgi:hypothetical protein
MDPSWPPSSSRDFALKIMENPKNLMKFVMKLLVS